MDGTEMGNPKEKLTPARACGSERNASPATAKARTTGFFTIIETRKVYPRIQETVRGGQIASSIRVFCNVHTLQGIAMQNAVRSATHAETVIAKRAG